MNSGETDAFNDLANSNPLTPPLPASMSDEFRSALLSFASTSGKGPLAGHSSTSDISSFSVECFHIKSEINSLTIDVLRDLRRIADRMIAAGHSRECTRVYASARKSTMDESFKILGIENLSAKSVQRLEWCLQKEKIRLWIRNAEICVRVLFAEERRLSEHIFSGLGNSDVDDACFVETVSDHADLLFNFVEAISNGRKSPEKLFCILDLYIAISNLLADVKTVFQWKLGKSVCKKVVEILLGLADAARAILSEFEKAVVGEPTKFLMAGGSIHPLNTAVMNYIDSIVDYKQILAELIVSKPSQMELGLSEFEVELELESKSKSSSPLVLHLLWIIKLLKLNLKAKSKHYKNAALAHFFTMNNVHYIVHKIRGSIELREMIGDEFTNMLTDEYNLAASLYLRSSWKKVFDCLRIDGLEKLGGLFFGSVSVFVSRQRFKAFDARFRDVVAAQSGWFLADAELREELRITVLQMIMPLYTAFLRRHGKNVERLKQSGNYCVDVEQAVMSLFEGY